MEPPSCIKLPSIKSNFKTSESVQNLLSLHYLKLPLSFHRSKSIESFSTVLPSHPIPKEKEEEKKSQSEKIFFNSVDPLDPAIFEYLLSFKEYLHAIRSQAIEIEKEIACRKFTVPGIRPDRKVLIFDIDETLLCTIAIDTEESSSESILRPHCREVLCSLSEWYDIWVWTSALKEHGECVIQKYIDPNNCIIKKAFFRDQCIHIFDDIYIKDIRIFSNLLPSNVAIIENQLISFSTILDNGFLVDSYNGNDADEELLLVKEFFSSTRFEKDIRTTLINTFKFKESISAVLDSAKKFIT